MNIKKNHGHLSRQLAQRGRARLDARHSGADAGSGECGLGGAPRQGPLAELHGLRQGEWSSALRWRRNL